MKKTVKAAMLLGVITLSMVSCDKDDNQLQMKKEVKVNGMDQEMEKDDWGVPPIKPPVRKIMNNINDQEIEKDDWGVPPIKPPVRKTMNNINDQEIEKDDWGVPPIKPPVRK
ncbi:hypothetical protein HX025_03435 [Myroides odoratimimus]|uniref:hypothetical protein n=1 Tax=Myroides odoratimimus TaxID=76832 RepID=UPI0025750966|nr:hypothetical protein [Myroides odoratimimus]MDM1455709.1 hypothetical protein [Myroides odoratimimus]